MEEHSLELSSHHARAHELDRVRVWLVWIGEPSRTLFVDLASVPRVGDLVEIALDGSLVHVVAVVWSSYSEDFVAMLRVVDDAVIP